MRLRVSLLLLFVAPLLYAANPCRDCHEEVVARVAAGPHANVVARDAQFCAACHGDPAKHLASNDKADIISGGEVARFSAAAQTAACAKCHVRQHPQAHESCWECHEAEALHRGVAARTPYELCTSCHRDVVSQFRMHYRHPVESGVVTCTSCHDVHGPDEVREETCLACHEEQKGPFLFEHAAMEDGCGSCHAPHGSPHRGQLKSAGNGICLGCHLQADFEATHDFRLAGGGRCWDCHSDVHGSNITPDLNPRGRR